MPVLNSLITSLQELTIAQEVAIRHDEARVRYRLNANTVPNFRGFEDAITDYYAYHFGECIARGAHLSREEASGRAKELIEQGYRRRRGDIVSAFTDARDGTNGGLRQILDIIADGLKEDSIVRYTRYQFDTYIAPNDFDAKVDLIRQFFRQFGHQLPSSVDLNRPERYCTSYQELVNAFVQGLRETSSIFRRL